MIKLIIPLLKAPSTIIKHRKMYACNHSGFLFRNNNLQDYTINEDDEINEAKTRIDVYFAYSHHYCQLNNSPGLSN